MSTTIGLCLEPLDVLFFRDGRPFDAATKVVSGLPTPQVLAGAVRTALLEKFGCDFAALRESTRAGKSFAEGLRPDIRWIAGVKFRGPWLCRLPDAANTLDVFLPVPATLHTPKKGTGGIRILKPLKEGELLGWTDDRGLRPLWLDGTAATDPAQGFLDSAGLTAFLAGKLPEEGSIRKSGDFHDHDTRTGIGIKPDELTTGDGEIYGIRFLSMKCGFGFYADIDLPEEKAVVFDDIPFLAFGGEGKRVAVHTVEPFAFPEYKPEAGKKSFLLLTTPSVTVPNGQPYFPKDVKCAAAAVNTPVAISGWDIAKGGPKPTRFASPVGSVYFLDTTDPVPEQIDEFGYGCHLQGVWTDG